MFKHRKLFVWDCLFLILVILILLDVVALIRQFQPTNTLDYPPEIISNDILEVAPTSSITSNTDQLEVTTTQVEQTSADLATTTQLGEAYSFFTAEELEKYNSLSSQERLDLNLAEMPIVSVFNTNDILPADILRQVGYYGAGGGGPGCFDDTPLTIGWAGGLPETAALGDFLGVAFGGSQYTESVAIKTVSTSGQSIVEELQNWSFCGIWYTLNWNNPTGVYTISLTNESTIVEANIHVIEPDKPTIFATENGFLLYKFLPNEHLRLFIYEYNEISRERLLVEWIELQVNPYGQLGVEIPVAKLLENYEYTILGDSSGQVAFPQYPYFYFLSNLNQHDFLGKEVELREYPGFDQPVLERKPLYSVTLDRTYFDDNTQTLWVSFWETLSLNEKVERWILMNLVNFDEFTRVNVVNSRGSSADVRSGPGTLYEVLDAVTPDIPMLVIANSYFDEVSQVRWLPVRLEDGTEGWVDGTEVEVISALPDS